MAIDTLSLTGKIAIVTGSGRENGIGAGIAIVLARNGAAVTIHYVHDSTTQRAHAVADKIKADGGKAIVVQGSIETPQGAQYLVDETLKGFDVDHIDILVNNAGVGIFGETLTANQSDITQVFDVNVKGPIFVAQAVVPVMPPGGRIVNISSIASKLGYDSVPIYGASKAAIDSLTWSWAKEARPVTTDSNPYEEFQKPSIDITRAADRADVNIFFPLLLKSDMIEIFDAVAGREVYGDERINVVEMPQYGLLLVVLCLALLSSSGRSNIRLDGKGENYRPSSDSDDTVETQTRLMYHLWDKARLVLGYISTDMSIAAAQSSMLSSIFMGACGKVAESFHWAHATAVKCESMARSYAKNEPIPDSFRRLYWISFIYECDFISEISVLSPSGIARSENKIPYPAFTTENYAVSPSAPESSEMASTRSQEELVAFQITTNSAIRRFLNTVNSVVYDDKEQFRTRQSNYACWLLRISEDLWSHHSAIYRNLPEFLLTNSSQDVSMAGTDSDSPASLQSPTARIRDLPTGNNSWNILRLKGRYYAGQYIIHRPFIEFIVLNIDNFETHPSKDVVLKKSKSCLDGCMGFIKVFDVETVNALTCLFPTGMV
ncbi:hypothetical protein FPSE5266_08940 [Fusarium pseudograminearum]|nr:hypothetical protein FPSE5266_08940 [Fusarium pseudograminearum]